ncbi:MAG: hypothetical protein ABI091_31245, partial [Ferruginibacter sp.]
MKLILAIAICLSSMTSSFAQNNTSAFLGPNKNTVADTAAKPKILQFTKTFELEVDPLAYVLNGYSVHGSYNYNHFKYDVGFYGIQVPTELDNNKNFTTKSIGFGLKVAYLFKYVNGFYIAFDGDFLQNDVTAKKTGEKDKGHNVGLGI